MSVHEIFAPRPGFPAGGVHGFLPENVRIAQGVPAFEAEPSLNDPFAVPHDAQEVASKLQQWAEYRHEVHFDRPEPKLYTDPKWTPGARPMINHFPSGQEFVQNPTPFRRIATYHPL